MHTTLRINDALMSRVKKAAATSGRTLTAFMEDALRQAVAKKKSERRSKPVRLVTFKGKGVAQGVDLDNTASLLEMMEST